MGKQEIKTAAKMSGRIAYFDVLNILATISVVWIHFGNEVYWYDGSQVWYWCLFIQVLCYWAVPVFFMLTSATLMNYNGQMPEPKCREKRPHLDLLMQRQGCKSN